MAPPSVIVPLGSSSLVLWLWHVPAIYEAAMASHVLYWGLQAGLVAAFTWFWSAVIRSPADPLPRLTAIGVGAGQMGLLGALLTFAPEPLYATHSVAPVAWGLTPLADQQLAGLLMWVPAFLLYGLLAIAPARQLLRDQPA
jgi:putative membrane protein